jgi:thioredoxin
MHQVKTQGEFDEKLGEKQLAVVKFTASWCGPCKAIAPVVEQLAKKYPQVEFFEVDVDQSKDIAQRHSVTAMPTFVYFRDQSEVNRVRGADPDGIAKALKEFAGDSGDANEAASTLLTVEERKQYIPKGFDVLNDLVHFGEAEILNVKQGSIRTLFDPANAEGTQVMSDADSQILTYTPFNNKTKVYSLLLKVGKLPSEAEQIAEDEEDQPPTKIKIWANTTSIISFDDAAAGVKALHQGDLPKPDENGWIEIKLRYVLFPNVTSIVIVLDGADEDASTVVQRIALIGDKGESKDQGKLEALE